MSVGTSIAEGDWSAPATRGELMSVKHDLERKVDGLGSKIDQVATKLDAKIDQIATKVDGKIDLLDSKVDRVEAGLRAEMAGLRVEMKDLQWGTIRMIWIAVGAMTAVGILLRFF